jgi:NAD+ diphosphatase
MTEDSADRAANLLAGPYLDRRSQMREQADWLDAARADGNALFILARGTTQLVRREPRPHIAFLTSEHPLVRAATEDSALLLGWFGEQRVLLVEPSDAELESAGAAQLLPHDATFVELRPLVPLLDEREASLLAYARALGYWRARHRWCGVCGARCAPQRAGHVMHCTTGCGTDYFPRIDPAIIVLVTDGEHALLGRQASWPPGRYSTIAGFVEPGESLEDAVAREVQEETGVDVIDVDYVSSQPWPFPSSLMLGFHATARAGAPIHCNDAELEDARWFTRAQIAAGEALLPPRVSISYRLIERWFDAGSAQPLAQQRGVGRWERETPPAASGAR